MSAERSGLELRQAHLEDLERLLPWMHRFNDHEGIAVDPTMHRRAVEQLLGDPTLGVVFVARLSSVDIGYAVVTYNFDLEFAGRDAFLTELWIEAQRRGRGLGRAIVAAIFDALRTRDVKALQLAVRPENARALRLYRSLGFEDWTRLALGRRL